jgi:Fe2+ transport system protein B
LTKEEAATILVELRKEAKNPEDISKNDLLFILDSISENSIEKMIQEQEYSKRKAEQQEEENAKLKKEIEKEVEEKKIALAKEGEKEIVINNIRGKIKDKCHRKWTERVNCCLWVIWGLPMSIIVFFELYLFSYGPIFLAFIITIVFAELRFQKNFLSKLPPKITEWIPSKWLNFFPEIRSNFEKKLTERCITKERENTGLDST